MSDNKALQKLLDQQKVIQKKIKDEQKKEALKKQAIIDKKALLVGQAIIKDIRNNPSLKNTLQPVFDEYITSKSDRELLGMDEIKKIEGDGL